MSECNECIKYQGDCGFHLKDSNGHINYDCPDESYCDRCGHCTEFIGKPKVRHQFEFVTSSDWKPTDPTCWTECPFSKLIKLGESCRFLDPFNGIKCPFIDTTYSNSSKEYC